MTDDPRLDPSHLRPMLAVRGTVGAVRADHGYEFKWDGVRALVHTDGERLSVRARTGNEIRPRYPELEGIVAALGRPAVLDGEVVALDPDGRPSFALLQHRMHLADPGRVAAARASQPVALLLFDLLALDGSSWLDRPYEERREGLVGLRLGAPAWQVPPAGDDLAAMLRIADERGLEGVVAKRLGSPYRAGQRSRDWTKLTFALRQEVVVGGWRPGRGGRSGQIGSLLIGVHDDDGALRFAGAVGSGLTDRDLDEFGGLLTEVPQSPFADPVAMADARFVRPEIVVEVRFRHWTDEGRLRAPVYLGRRSDRDPTEVRRERGVPGDAEVP